MQRGQPHRGGHARGLALAVEGRGRQQHRGAHALVAEGDLAAAALEPGAGGQQGRVGAVGVPGRDDAPGVDARGELAAQHLVERKGQVLHARDGLGLAGRLAQAGEQFQRVAPAPQPAVAADVLQVQAGAAVRRPVAAQVAVAAPRAAQTVREHHQRHRRRRPGGQRQVQQRGHRAFAPGVLPVELEGVEAASAGRGGERVQRGGAERGRGGCAPGQPQEAATTQGGAKIWGVMRAVQGHRARSCGGRGGRARPGRRCGVPAGAPGRGHSL